MKKLILLFTICTLLTTRILLTQWVQQTVPVSKPITGIKFIDSLKGWACTGTFNVQDTGYIINTTDGGTNWYVQLFYPAMKFVDIEFINQNTGYIAGNQNDSARTKLFKTTNGGGNWSYINMVPNMYIDDMQFLNKDSAWECGQSAGPDVRTTTDGGNNWIVRTSGIMAATQRIFFLNYNTGFCGADFYLYKTTNAGLNWSLLSGFSTLVQSIYFLNLNTGWVGLSPSIASKVGYTTNGGTNWMIQDLLPYIINISDIFFFNGQLGFAGIGDNIIYKTINSGINWGYQNDTSGSFRMSFTDSLHGWSGYYSNGNVSHTTNGGGPIFYTGFTSNSNKVPASYKLYQNYPNPFNPYTTIKLDVNRTGPVNLYIYDILGRILYTIINQNLASGTHEFNWDSGSYSSGVYICRVTGEGFSGSIKMILVK